MLKLIFEFYLTLAIPLIYFLGLIIVYHTPSTIQYPLSTIPGFVLALFGLILWIWVYLTLRSSLSVLPKAKKLITHGPYKYFRHPMYLGIILTFFGLSLAASSILGLIYTIFIIIPLNIFRIKREETLLLQKFGKRYKEYQERTFW